MKELKFIHITKTAGTSIENAGAASGLQWGLYHTEYGWHHQVTSLVSPALLNKYDWFMVVRNPYNRILSEYHCKWGGPQPIVSLGLFKKRKTPKESMNEYLIRRIRSASLSGNHYTPQTRYLHPSATIHVLKFEHLQTEFDALMATYGLKGLVLKRENTTTKRFEVSDFSPELIALINEVYHEDFVRFGYPKL